MFEELVHEQMLLLVMEDPMFKHANTVFPGDQVKVIGSTVNKIASNESGKVVKADPESGRVKVAFADGRDDWVDLDKLEKLG